MREEGGGRERGKEREREGGRGKEAEREGKCAEDAKGELGASFARCYHLV